MASTSETGHTKNTANVIYQIGMMWGISQIMIADINQ